MKEICGIIVCGGKSSRMKADKSLLKYHGKPQYEHLHDMLQPFCDHVLLSCNRQQAEGLPSNYGKVIDSEQFPYMGPLTGVLSAHAALPQAALLVVGCDYPLIEKGDIEYLLANTVTGSSVVFRNEGRFIEPMLSLMQNNDLQKLLMNYQEVNCSLRRFMETSDFLVLDHPQPGRLLSVDTPEEYQQIIRQIANK